MLLSRTDLPDFSTTKTTIDRIYRQVISVINLPWLLSRVNFIQKQAMQKLDGGPLFLKLNSNRFSSFPGSTWQVHRVLIGTLKGLFFLHNVLADIEQSRSVKSDQKHSHAFHVSMKTTSVEKEEGENILTFYHSRVFFKVENMNIGSRAPRMLKKKNYKIT